MALDPKDHPHFKSPPINEVVFGLLFQEISNLSAPLTGKLWEKFQKEYPNCEEKAELPFAVEKTIQEQHQSIEMPTTEIQLLNVPPLPRIWFVSEDKNKLIQIQRNRFHHNWRKINPGDEYPSYHKVIKEFKTSYGKFEEFIKDFKLDPISPLQLEITYINHILIGEGWKHLTELSNVFPDFGWRKEHKYLKNDLETLLWRFSFPLLNQEGRIHVSIRNGYRVVDKVQLIIFELTARGLPKEVSKREKMWDWFENAHEWLVKTFNDLTNNEIQNGIWGKK